MDVNNTRYVELWCLNCIIRFAIQIRFRQNINILMYWTLIEFVFYLNVF